VITRRDLLQRVGAAAFVPKVAQDSGPAGVRRSGPAEAGPQVQY
jgi:hypothetical protein